jgi:putative transposase
MPIKAVKQSYRPSLQVLALLEDFRLMVNECIRLGLRFEEENHVTPSMKKLSLLCYRHLKRYEVYSAYRLTAISKAAGILSARRKSIKRGFFIRSPYVSRPLLVSCYHVKIQDGTRLRVQLGGGRCEFIPLTAHTLSVLSDTTLRASSFTLTSASLSICISKETNVEPRELTGTIGIDRNLRNLTVGNEERVTYYDMTKVVQIAENTRSIVRSFKRADIRIRQRISSKYGRRRSERVKQIIHGVTRQIVQEAKATKQAIVFEDIRGIRRLYRRGNGQGRSFRARMNSWPFYEVKRQIEYKAAWEGLPVITLSRKDTQGTTMDCARCGERLQSPVRGDLQHSRQLWCGKCGRWMDRDLVAVLNISRRGRVRFARSSKEGEADETVRGNAEHEGEPLILRVDASKLQSARRPQ